jgi:hypothetical protein
MSDKTRGDSAALINTLMNRLVLDSEALLASADKGKGKGKILSKNKGQRKNRPQNQRRGPAS